MTSRRGLTILYAAIPPTLFALILVVAMMLSVRVLEQYDIRVTRRTTSEKQVKFGRTPIVLLGQERYAVLGVKYHSRPEKRAVIVRNLYTNQIMTAFPGQAIFGGAKVLQISNSQITFSKDSQTVIVGLPDDHRPSRRRWI